MGGGSAGHAPMRRRSLTADIAPADIALHVGAAGGPPPLLVLRQRERSGGSHRGSECGSAGRSGASDDSDGGGASTPALAAAGHPRVQGGGRAKVPPPADHLRFVRTRKVAADTLEECRLLSQFLALNDTAVYKIVKKLAKQTRRAADVRGAFMEGLHTPASPYAFLAGAAAAELSRRAAATQRRLRELAPQHAAWRRAKVYTIGCFDLVHHGHINLLKALRTFGNTVIVGIHDDASYQLLKGEGV